MALIKTLKKLPYKPHSTLCILISEYDITYVKAMSNHLKLCNFITAKTVQNVIRVCKQKTDESMQTKNRDEMLCSFTRMMSLLFDEKCHVNNDQNTTRFCRRLFQTKIKTNV